LVRWKADNPVALRLFLRNYQSRILLPLELMAVHRAYEYASRNELNELMAMDERLTREPILRDFAAVSRRIGQYQLQRLRPLRDQRFVQRYLLAVEQSEAHGWHTLVYGVTLALYSLPLRQGLMGFARQTLRGFIHCSARPLRLSESDCQSLLDEQCAGLPGAVEGLLMQVAAA
jgi:urease accessory protein UreF